MNFLLVHLASSEKREIPMKIEYDEAESSARADGK